MLERLPFSLLLAVAVGAAACAPRPGAAPSPMPTPAGAATPAGSATAPAPPPLAAALEPLASGFTKPLWVGAPPDGSGDLFVLEQAGTVRVIRQGVLVAQPFLDLRTKVKSSGSEQGLLGLAFHPKYRQNRQFFVNYTANVGVGDTVIERYTAVADGSAADPNSARLILTFPQPYENHNGGNLVFGPDGMLWIGTGDGGSGGDPRGNGQNRNALLGKLLRIDVDGGDPYAIPADNPFASAVDARPEVWAIGLRNPWRYSFDRAAGDLWIADVGQNSYEEVDRVPAGAKPPLNFGWNLMEASHCFPSGRTGCSQDGLTLPVAEYRTGPDGCAVTGGYVYRGARFPALQGRYVFSDYCKGFIATLRPANGSWVRDELLPPGGVNISAFGEDAGGELYVTGLNTGTVYRLVVR